MADHTGYPDMLAAGITPEDGYTPFQLFAGEKQPVSDQITTGASALVQFQTYAKDRNGFAIPFNPDAGRATGTITFAAQPTAADTLTIAGVVITFVSAITDATSQVLIGASTTLTAANLRTFVNAHSATLGVTAQAAANTVVTVEAVADDEEGNAVTLAKSGTNPTLSGATLTGGGEQSAGDLAGITAQPIAANSNGPSFVEGIFNHEALVWPASLTTLAQRKLATQGTGIEVRRLL